MAQRWTGADLRSLRVEAGLPRAAIATKLGVSTSRIRNAEELATVPEPLRERIVGAILELVRER